MADTPVLSRVPSRDAILASNDRAIEFCATPEWTCDVYVRSLAGSERDLFEGSLLQTDRKGKRSVSYKDMRAKLVVRTACDAEGNLLFSPSDVDALTLKSAAALQRVFEVAQRLSRLSDTDVAELTTDLKNDQPEGSLSV